MNSKFQMRLAAFLIGVAVTLVVSYSPAVARAVWASILPRPSVSRDWVKARCFEYSQSTGRADGWSTVSDTAWYFDTEHFGIRRFDQADGTYLLVIAPDGDGPHSYLYRSDGRLQESTDDATSIHCCWSDIKDERTAASVLDYGRAYHDIGQ